MPHDEKGQANAFAALKEMQELLSAHPGFVVMPVRSSSGRIRKSALGRLIRNLRFRRTGAEFDGGLTLLNFRLRRETLRTLILDLNWHATGTMDGLTAFIHFVDAAGEIRFQGDYPLEDEVPDLLGFFYSRRKVHVPETAGPGTYRVRLGVWNPSEKKHVPLQRFRGFSQETAAWCHDSVILASIELDEDGTE